MALNYTNANSAIDRRAEDLSNVVIPLRTRDEFISEISRLWKEATDKFYVIGRYLINAKEILPYGEYDAMIKRELPFSPDAGRRIVLATKAVDSGSLPRDRLPNSYSIVYELSTLSEEDLRVAEQQGLIRPDLKRNEIISFKKSRSVAHVSLHEQLRLEREKILADVQRMQARLAEIDSQIGGELIEGTVQKGQD